MDVIVARIDTFGLVGIDLRARRGGTEKCAEQSRNAQEQHPRKKFHDFSPRHFRLPTISRRLLQPHPVSLSAPSFIAVLFEEGSVEIGSMNLAVAQRACLEKRILVMETGGSGRSAKARLSVTLQAQQIYVAYLQHMGIGSSVRNVAGLASLDLYRLMFENKGAFFVGMACKTNDVLRRRRPYLLRFYCAMHIVAVAALH